MLTVTDDTLQHLCLVRVAQVLSRQAGYSAVSNNSGHGSLHYGVHIPFSMQGLGNTTLFCGGGISDLTALSPVDVCMAVLTIEYIFPFQCRAWATPPCFVVMASTT